MRVALGTAVFYGMLGVTLFGLIFTPVFYVVIRGIFGGAYHPASSPGTRFAGRASGIGNACADAMDNRGAHAGAI